MQKMTGLQMVRQAKPEGQNQQSDKANKSGGENPKSIGTSKVRETLCTTRNWQTKNAAHRLKYMREGTLSKHR